ncbi:DUF6156 family protein [Roseibium marinum]|uniref:Uncharacterized protein n=1 Tax=Roseibium marinum TaxID=281252 RepID=A0A2S3V1M4_9HYPH|nr:DUF6156 family protein [Roseibium marinum]POF33877.1 hypothetical protein CLV41_101326 [Roseibium marinum]
MPTEDMKVSRDCRYFVTYAGVKLPFRLVNPIDPDSLSNRNTYIRAYFEGPDILVGFDKVVYGEIELSHRYTYHAGGMLKQVEITMLEDDPVVLDFDETGQQSR